MAVSMFVLIINLFLLALVLAAAVYLFLLLVRALRKYIGSKPVREKKAQAARSLGEMLKERRTAAKMTQEFVETIGVSRQAVSKWESGRSDPSTTNLIALARLFGIEPEELLRAAEAKDESENKTEG